MRLKSITIMLALTVAFGLGMWIHPAHAGDEVRDVQWYAGAGVALSFGKEFADPLRDAPKPSWAERDLNEIAPAGKLFVGRHFNENLALEAFFAFSGKYGGDIGVLSMDINLTGFGLAAVGMTPLSESGRWWGLAKAGLFRWKVSTDVYPEGADSFSVDAEGISPMIGIGVRYGRYKDVFARWEIEYYPNVGDKNKTGESDLIMVFFPVNFAIGF